MASDEMTAGRGGLDAFLDLLIASAPWYARGTIGSRLGDDVRNAMVQAVADGGQPALDAYLDELVARQTSMRSEIAAYLNADFRAKLAGAIEGPIEALRN